LAVGAAQACVLILLVEFHRPALLPAALPLLRALGGDGATHYPAIYYALPVMMYRANLVIGVILTPLAAGLATFLFAESLAGEVRPGAWKRVLRGAPSLVGIGIVLTGVVYGIGTAAGALPREFLLGNAAVRWGIRGIILLLMVLVQGFIAYATAWIVLMGHGFWRAVRDSARVTVRTFLPTMIVVAVPALALFPLSYASTRVDVIAGRLKPEMVTALIGVELLAQVVLTFVLLGAITRLFLWRVEAAR
jgi:hypothetical protein